MSRDDSGGLLSKVVKFVRNPATNWSDLDHAEDEHDSLQSRQMLKELVERKKRNDFVRKREFEMLRKLRRRELASVQSPAARPSFFQSSLPSRPDERAQTLKKIDEIEAQMSMQWWKTKHRDSIVNSSVFTSSLPSSAPGTVPPPAPVTPAVAAVPPVPTAPPMLPPIVEMPVAPAPDNAGPPTDFSASRSFAIEVGEIAHDPELEEASIRFANGDDAGTEAGLREVLGEGGLRQEHAETWLTLFDFYRATGQQDRFDAAAIDFANRFQRSAPQWFSMPAQVEQLATKPAPGAAPSQNAHWSCPPLVTAKSLQVLAETLTRSPQPWRLDWTRLHEIDTSILPVLTRQFQDWAGQKVQLAFVGGGHLGDILEARAPVSDRSVSTDWWHLRLAYLRLLGRMDDFELVALNYCVTYEVSPPSWEAPRCVCKAVNANGDSGSSVISGLSSLDGMAPSSETGHTDFRSTTLDSQLAATVTVELSGRLVGDIASVLERLDASFRSGDTLRISCARLIRVDFAAAGDLLNWASLHHSHGRFIQFVDVQRLVALFFNVIGISDQSTVFTRKD
jgi:anti-anti-sigma regulatory factor